MIESAQGNPLHVKELCPKCGLCCNGVLFADVQLQPGDDAKRLAELNLALRRKKSKTIFTQPCSCFDGKWCRIYSERPGRCRDFECGLLQQVDAGQLTVPAALKRIRQAQHQAEKVRVQLRKLGSAEEQMALTHRYALVMKQPIDFSNRIASAARGALMRQVSRLMELIHAHFLA